MASACQLIVRGFAACTRACFYNNAALIGHAALPRTEQVPSVAGDVHENRIRRVRSFANELQSELIDNQLEAYRATLPAGTDLADDPWGAQLLAEAAALKDEDLRLPWEEGLPAQTRASLEPYSTRLDQSYDSMTSIIEIGLVDVD